MMQRPLTTNEVRRRLEDFGAVQPGVRAVRMVADLIDQTKWRDNGEVRIWQFKFCDETIRRAVVSCKGLRGEASYKRFEEALRDTQVAA